MPRNLEELVADLRELLEGRGLLNLHAQAHARSLLTQLRTPIEEWPSFAATLDERLYYAAHLMLVRGMELAEEDGFMAFGKDLLVRAAEALEFIADIAQVRVSQFDERLNAAVAYHVAGFHARSYVIVSQIDATVESRFATDSISPAIFALLRRDLREVLSVSIGLLDAPSLQDASLAAGLYMGESDDDAAIASLGRRSLLESLLLYLEYVKRGDSRLLLDAQGKCQGVAALGKEAGHVDLWWLGLCIEKLLKDLGNASLWHNISDLGSPYPDSGAIKRYIESGLRDSPSFVTLWPSQLKALSSIKAENAPSFCLRMPTSAGKTKIAELCILRTLLGSIGNAKCLYIAPFRSLAVEIEGTLNKGLRPLGIRVSEIYGGFDLTAADESLIRETQVLVATPEKFDATIRLSNNLLEDVQLVIIDEGHIAGEISDRGIRAEFLINRLLWKLGRESCRHVFISAVLPNPKEFASWVAGSADQVVESDWRPSRLVLGECEWNPNRGTARISFTHQGSQPLEQGVFIQPFVRERPVQGIPGCGRRRNPFPANANEAFAACVLRFASYGTTLAFVPQARQVDSTARTLMASMGLMRALADHEGDGWDFKEPDTTSPRMASALKIISEELGEGSDVVTFLRAGIAIHRGSLPGRVKVEIERLIRSGELRIIVATTTLGQGVNLPIRTILVRGLQQGQYSAVNPMTFWNIAGRAGRAMHENEGHVLFFNDVGRNRSVVQRQRRVMAGIIDKSAIRHVIGLLHRILQLLARRWKANGQDLSFEGLCLKLAENDFNWVSGADQSSMREIFDIVDQHLLALAIEGEIGPNDLDALQEILRESLLFAQLEARPIERFDHTAATSVLASRLKWVFRRVPESNRREQYYQMGMSLHDCETIEAERENLLEIARQAESWANLSLSGQFEILGAIVDIADRVDATHHAATWIPANASELVMAWLRGQKCIEMIESGLGASLDDDAGKLSRFLEEYCVYGLTWVVSGFVSFVRRELEDLDLEVPAIWEHIPAMFKVGVPDPLAAVFTHLLQMDRTLAMRAAEVCPHEFTNMNAAIAWMHHVSDKELAELEVPRETAAAIIRKRRQLRDVKLSHFQASELYWRMTFRSRSELSLEQDDPVIIRPRSDLGAAHYDLFDVKGNRVVSLRRKIGRVPEWMYDPLSFKATVESVVTNDDGRTHMTVRIMELAS